MIDGMEEGTVSVTEKGMGMAADILVRDGFVTGDETNVFDICDACHKWVDAFRERGVHTEEKDKEAMLVYYVMATFDQIRLKMN